MGEKKQRAAKKAVERRRRAWLPVYALVGCALAGAVAVYYRRLYPLKQRCPPPDDRFHDHCSEGRKHYQIEIDWSCLGTKRSTAMRMALGIPTDDDLSGVGRVPSWLTDAHAEIVRFFYYFYYTTILPYCTPTSLSPTSRCASHLLFGLPHSANTSPRQLQVRASPCIVRLRADTACRYCMPTPRPVNASAPAKDESHAPAPGTRASDQASGER